jgi:signal transduction histidine kinase
MATNERKLGKNDLVFQVKPRLLMLLGDQLIRDATLAVFELVKNAYDADATACDVVLTYTGDPTTSKVSVQDNGSGMDAKLLRDVWMMIATDFRTKQREQNIRSKKFGRFPLGEKGLGRLSIHKLGRTIKMVTRVKGGDELVFDINWDQLEEASSLETAPIALKKREPETFPGSKHGTRLEVTRLREMWSRGDVRKLHRSVNSLTSPFDAPGDFTVSLAVPGHEEWLKDLFTADEASKCALYRITGSFSGDAATFDYEFTPPPGYSRQLRKRSQKGNKFKLDKREGRKSVRLDLSAHQIGKVEFEFWLFDRDSKVMHAVTDDVKGLKDYLNENGGVRIYRDGIRVYDFGEPGNDWLNLDLRRVNTPTARTSNNQILGALELDSAASKDLREKTNREGFIETPAYEAFRDAVISLLTQIEAEKVKDQRRLREALGKGTGRKIFERFAELREVLEEKGVLAEVEPKLKEVEKEIQLYQDQLLHSAVPGLTIGVMLHGAEKLLEELKAAVDANESAARIRSLIDQLYNAMRPVTNLLKNPHPAKTSAASLIGEALFSAEIRLRRHKIKLINQMEAGGKDFPVRGSKQMLIASITNLIDNSIHWLESKNPKQKLLYIGTSFDLDGGPTIVVGDNGPGFGSDDPEDLVEPFFSRRTGGMGMGLYIVSEVMRVNKGRLVFPASGDVELPDEIDGAVVGLQFEGEA